MHPQGGSPRGCSPGPCSRTIKSSSHIRLIAAGRNARRLQGSRPVAHLRVIKDVSTALRQDREKKIALPKLKKELAVHPCMDVHQLDAAGEPFMAFPHALDLNEPCVVLCLHDLAGEHILGAVEAGLGRDWIASTCMCSADAPHPADRQDKEPTQIPGWVLHWSSRQRSDERIHGRMSLQYFVHRKARFMSSPDLEERIARVMSDLREETTLPGQYRSPCPVQKEWRRPARRP